jgi:hypothetical protein
MHFTRFYEAEMYSMVQVAHTDVTLDDMWSLDLVRLDGWRSVKVNSQGEEAFQEEEGWETDVEGEDDAADDDDDDDVVVDDDVVDDDGGGQVDDNGP